MLHTGISAQFLLCILSKPHTITHMEVSILYIVTYAVMDNVNCLGLTKNEMCQLLLLRPEH